MGNTSGALGGVHGGQDGLDLRCSTDHLLHPGVRILNAVNSTLGGLHDVVERPTKLTFVVGKLAEMGRIRIFALNRKGVLIIA